jgi:hypothetical protein
VSVVGTALKRAMERQGKTIDGILDQPEDKRAIKSSSETSTDLMKQLVAELSSQSSVLVPYPSPQPAIRVDAPSWRLRYGLLCLIGTVVMTALFTTVGTEVINIKRQLQSSASAEETPVVRLANWVQPEQSSQRQDRSESSLSGESTKSERQPDLARIEHNHAGFTSMDLIPGAVRHRYANGDMGNWLAPRQTDGSTEMIRVRPFTTTLNGVFVHSYKDGQDYFLTPTGEWISGSKSPN